MDISWSMKQIAKYHKLMNHNGWGRDSYKPSVKVKIRLREKQRLIRTANGEEVMSDAEILAPLHIRPKPDDLFTHRGRRFKVLSDDCVIELYGETNHRKLFCASVQVKLPGEIDWPSDDDGEPENGTGQEP